MEAMWCNYGYSSLSSIKHLVTLQNKITYFSLEYISYIICLKLNPSANRKGRTAYRSTFYNF